jgi:hypothetical protein
MANIAMAWRGWLRPQDHPPVYPLKLKKKIITNHYLPPLNITKIYQNLSKFILLCIFKIYPQVYPQNIYKNLS